MISEFIRYNKWANRRVMQACQDLSEQQLETPIPGGYGTILETLQHIVEAEAFYVDILTGDRPRSPYPSDVGPTLHDLMEYSLLVGEALTDAAKRIRAEDRVLEERQDGEVTYQALGLFIQIINHGIEHRTNITTVLNQGLMEPPDVDGWAYLWSHQDRFELRRSNGSH